MSDEYNDGFEAGYAYAKKEFEKEKERMIKEIESKMPTRDDTVTNTLLCMGERMGLCEAIEIIRGGKEE